MRTDDIIALTVLTVAGVTGYLLYTKQIKWPEDILPNPFEDNDSKKDEEKNVKDNIKDSVGDDFDAKDFISDAFQRGEDIIKIPKDFLSNALKTGQDLLRPKSTPTSTKPSTNTISSPSLDDLITGAFKGHPFRPYSGTKYRPYS